MKDFNEWFRNNEEEFIRQFYEDAEMAARAAYTGGYEEAFDACSKYLPDE